MYLQNVSSDTGGKFEPFPIFLVSLFSHLGYESLRAPRKCILDFNNQVKEAARITSALH